MRSSPPVLQQTYIQNAIPTYEDILLRDDYPQLYHPVDQLVPTQNASSDESAKIYSVMAPSPPSENLADHFPVSDTAAITRPDEIDPSSQSNLRITLAQFRRS